MEPDYDEPPETEPLQKRCTIRDATGKLDWERVFWLGCEVYAYLVLIGCVLGIVMTKAVP